MTRWVYLSVSPASGPDGEERSPSERFHRRGRLGERDDARGYIARMTALGHDVMLTVADRGESATRAELEG